MSQPNEHKQPDDGHATDGDHAADDHAEDAMDEDDVAARLRRRHAHIGESDSSGSDEDGDSDYNDSDAAADDARGHMSDEEARAGQFHDDDEPADFQLEDDEGDADEDEHPQFAPIPDIPAEDAPVDELRAFIEHLRGINEQLPAWEEMTEDEARALVRDIRADIAAEQVRRVRRVAAVARMRMRLMQLPDPADSDTPPPQDERPVGVHCVAADSSCFTGGGSEAVTVLQSIRYCSPPSATADLITADQHARGRDVQGIPWSDLRRDRRQYRIERSEDYAEQAGFDGFAETLLPQLTNTQPAPTSSPSNFRFHQSTQAFKPQHFHHQLRHLLHAPCSRREVFGTALANSVQSIQLLDSDAPVSTVEDEAARTAVEESGQAADPACMHSTTLFDFRDTRTVVLSLNVRPPLLFLGGQDGELLLRNCITGKPIASIPRMTEEVNRITNSITFMRPALEEDVLPDGALLPVSGYGAERILVSSNASFARVYDVETLTAVRDFPEAVCVNYSLASPDAKLVAIAGDASDVWVRDAQSGELVHTLKGHSGDVFSLAWHPNLPLLATGAQDHTCRVYDIRRPDKSLYVLPAQMAPIRSIRFARSGAFLVLAEAADFVHVVDFTRDAALPVVQTLDVFGEISGVALSPDDSSIFIGAVDAKYGQRCLLEYQRSQRNTDVVDFFD